MKEIIEKIVYASGIWNDGRRESHAFLLSPDVFMIDRHKQELPLIKLGPAIRDCLAGVSRLMAIAANSELASGKHWRLVHDLTSAQVPRPFRQLQTLKPRQIPLIVKVDFIEDEHGDLKIAEIDAMNRRAMGYATLFNTIRCELHPDARSLPGIAPTLARELKTRGGNDRLILLYSERERFYRPEFDILAAALCDNGVTLAVASEKSFSIGEASFEVEGQTLPLTTPLISFPPLAQSPALTERLAELYRSGHLSLLMPPKPGLGSKNVLGVISNAYADPALEALLGSQIDPEALATVRTHLPLTYLVGKQHRSAPPSFRCILKETVSAGTKGVRFADDPDFNERLNNACRSNGTAILQQEIVTSKRSLGFYTPEGRYERANWHTRLVAYYINGVLAEAVATGCQNKLVHGGKEAINLGVILGSGW